MVEKELKLVSGSSPHIHSPVYVSRIMWTFLGVLLIPLFGAVYFFGLYTFFLALISVLSSMMWEYVFNKAFGGEPKSVLDGSAAVTGMLLAFNIPPNSPPWLPVIGTLFAIGVTKLPFGGIGRNIVNPALAARAFLLLSFPTIMAPSDASIYYMKPIQNLKEHVWFYSSDKIESMKTEHADAVTTATPLYRLKSLKEREPEKGFNPAAVEREFSIKDLFVGRVPGVLGETSALLLLIGALILLATRIITWHIPVSYLLGFGLIVYLFGGPGFAKGDILFHLLSGGVVLGAFYMATDYTTSPLTRGAQLIYGFSAGLLGAIIRLWSGYPEGVSFGILIMNLFVPIMDRLWKPRVFGESKNG